MSTVHLAVDVVDYIQVCGKMVGLGLGGPVKVPLNMGTALGHWWRF
jgi:hypothetical protein